MHIEIDKDQIELITKNRIVVIPKNPIKVLLAVLAGFNFGMLDLVMSAAEHDWIYLTVPFYDFTRATHWWWDFHCGFIMICVLCYISLDMVKLKVLPHIKCS